MISIDPKWLLERAGIQVDPELTELVTVFLMRLNSAPDKKEFVKNALRRALYGKVDP